MSYDLVYTRKEDSKKFLVKRVTPLNYNTKDPVTGKIEHLTRYRLLKEFSCMREFSVKAKVKKSCIRNLAKRIR